MIQFTYTDGIYEYFVGVGLGGKEYMVMRRKPKAVSSHRVKSKYLPVCETRDEAQTKLDEYASRKKYPAIPAEFRMN